MPIEKKHIQILAPLATIFGIVTAFEYVQVSIAIFVGQKEVGLSKKDVTLIASEVIITYYILSIFAAFFTESYIGKYYSILTGCVCGTVTNLFMLLVYIVKRNAKLAFFYTSLVTFIFMQAFLLTQMLAFGLDQLKMPKNKQLARIIVTLGVWEDSLSVFIDALITLTYPLYQTYWCSIIMFFLCLVSGVTIFLQRNDYRIKYHYRIVEKVIECWKEACSMARETYSRNSSHASVMYVINTNWISQVKKPVAIKEAAEQYWLIFQNLSFTTFFFAAISLLHLTWTNQIIWLRKDYWLSSMSTFQIQAGMKLLCVPFIELFLVPIINKVSKLFKSEISQCSLSLLFIGISIIATIDLQFRFENSVPVPLATRNAKIRIFNSLMHEVKLNIKSTENKIEPLKHLEVRHFAKGDFYSKQNFYISQKREKITKIIYAKAGETVNYILCQNRCSRIDGFDPKVPSFPKDKKTRLSIISCFDKTETNDTKLEVYDSLGNILENSEVPVEGKRLMFELFSEKLLDVRIKVGNKTKTLNLSVTGDEYILMIPKLNLNIDTVKFTFTGVSDLTYKDYILPILFSALAEANLVCACIRLVAYEAPEIIRTCAIAVFYFNLLVGVILRQRLLVIGGVAGTGEIIRMFVVIYAFCTILYIWILLRFNHYKWPEDTGS